MSGFLPAAFRKIVETLKRSDLCDAYRAFVQRSRLQRATRVSEAFEAEEADPSGLTAPTNEEIIDDYVNAVSALAQIDNKAGHGEFDALVQFERERKRAEERRMPWHQVQFSREDVQHGANISLTDRYSEIWLRAGGPKDAAIYSRQAIDGSLIVFFSPNAAGLALDLVREYAGEPCDQPTGVSRVVGDDRFDPRSL